MSISCQCIYPEFPSHQKRVRMAFWLQLILAHIIPQCIYN